MVTDSSTLHIFVLIVCIYVLAFPDRTSSISTPEFISHSGFSPKGLCDISRETSSCGISATHHRHRRGKGHSTRQVLQSLSSPQGEAFIAPCALFVVVVVPSFGFRRLMALPRFLCAVTLCTCALCIPPFSPLFFSFDLGFGVCC